MDPIQTMPEVDALILKTYTIKDWINYYKNVWVRNLAARCIDVQTDIALKAQNPDEMVQADDGRPIPVKERLELRKILVQDALNLLKGIDALVAIPEADFDQQVLSEDALKVAADMIDAGPKAGDVVEENGVKGKLESDGQGGLKFVADAPAPATPEAPAAPAQPVPGEDAN